MRIVAGDYRGRLLVAPKGHSTRPTADRARQALFDTLGHASWSAGLRDARVIDLFAGSGALGLEALSRGAAHCLFVDHDPAACAAIEANIAALGCGGRAVLSRIDATRLGPLSGQPPFDIAFLDPPYRGGLAELALDALAAGGWLAPEALAVVERGAAEGSLDPPRFDAMDSRVWGAAHVEFLRLRA